MKRLFACFAVLTIATASIACSLAAEPKAKPESPPQVYKVLPRLEIDKLDCVQFYCSVSTAIWIEYNRSGDAMVKCDALQGLTVNYLRTSPTSHHFSVV